MKELLRRIRQILKDRRVRRFFTRVVSTVAAIVVFVTTYALILPAITLEATPVCGVEAHQHTDECYEDVLVCEIPESDGHKHTDDCYSIELVLTCETEEHTHSVDNGCYDEDGNLICESPEHVHDADNGCYKEVRTLTCEIEESEGHHHGPECYEKVLTCGKEAHTHSTACYSNPSTGSTGEESESAAVASTESAAVGASVAPAVDDHSVDNGSTGLTNGTDSVNAGSGASTGSTTVEYDFNEESATAATTNVMPEEIATEDLSTGYVPELAPVDMAVVLDKHTGFYYFDSSAYAEEHTNEDGTVDMPASSSEIEDWIEYENGVELESSDLLRLYLSYTVPAGTLNETNQVSRYRLPSNIRLTDEQIIAINETVNGVAGSYMNMDSLEITDVDKYEFYRGAEAIEGTRTPDVAVNDYLYDLVKDGKEGQEYISAIVKAENVVNEHTGEVEAQDLIFIWTPYSIEKNQHEYDKDGQPVKAGEKITGWFSVDFNTAQVEWVPSDDGDEPNIETTVDEEAGIEIATTSVEKTADVVFVEKNNAAGTKEISTILTMVEKTVEEQPVEDDTTVGDTEDAEQSSTGETAEAAEETETADAATTGETAEDAEQSSTAATEAPVEEEREQSVEYHAGTLTASGDSYKITLDYTAEAEIPEDAQLKVSEITAESDPEAYEACLEQAAAQVAADDNTTVDKAATRFFDIEIVAPAASVSSSSDAAVDNDADATVENDTVDNESTADEPTVDNDSSTGGETGSTGDEWVKIEPKAPVSVNIQLIETAKTVADMAEEGTQQGVTSPDPTVLHFAEDGVETLESTTVDATADPAVDDQQDGTTTVDNDAQDGTGTQQAEGTAIQFETSSFSIYGVVYTSVITTTYITASGETYEITVTYEADAEIPEGSELKVREIESVKDEEEYNRYLSDSAKELGVGDYNDISFARFFDIQIIKGGEKIEPKAFVKVSIRHKDALEVNLGDIVNIVHFAEEGTEVIGDVKMSEDKKELAFEQGGFSVTGEIVSNPTGGTNINNPNQYALVVKYDGKFYSVDSDGTLTPVTVNDANNPTTVIIGSPMLWSYDTEGSIYHHTDATDINSGQVAADYYYKFIDINDESGIYEETQIEDKPEATYNNQNQTVENQDVVLQVQNSSYFTGTKWAWMVQNHKHKASSTTHYNSATHKLTNNTDTRVLDVELTNTGTLHLVSKPADESDGVEVFFTNVANSVPAVSPYNHTVNHVDISIEGDANVAVPLAYGIYHRKLDDGSFEEYLKIENGKYYIKDDGGEWVTAYDDDGNALTDKNPIKVHKELDITDEDIKSATLTATDKNGNPVNNAFYVSGYSANSPAAGEPWQVRIEGSFKVSTIAPITGYDPNPYNTMSQRLQNRVYYAVSTVKHNQALTVSYKGVELYNDQHERMDFTADIKLTSETFNYWDTQNKCPPLQPGGFSFYDTWQQGGIYVNLWGDQNDQDWWCSGIDYRLAGDKVVSEAEILGMEVTKYIVDTKGKVIKIATPMTSTFHVYEKKAGVDGYDPDDVKGVNGGEAAINPKGTQESGTLPQAGAYDPVNSSIYQGYTPHTQYDMTVSVGTNGRGLQHNYNVEEGMYYIVEDPSSIIGNETITDVDGNTYHYVQTHLETEYARRMDSYISTKYGGAYTEPVHVSQTYTQYTGEDAEVYRSIPDVIGNFKEADGSWVRADGTAVRNAFLEFYVYNVYVPDLRLDVEKRWVNADIPDGAQLTIDLYYAKRMVTDAEGVDVAPLAEWPEKKDYKPAANAKWDDSETQIFAQNLVKQLTLSADSQPEAWKGTFRGLPQYITDAEGNTWEFDYFARETAVTAGGSDLTEQFDVIERKTEPSEEEAVYSDGKVEIINAKGSISFEKKWLYPDGVTEFTPAETNAQIEAELWRTGTVTTETEVPDTLVHVTLYGKASDYRNGENVLLWEGDVRRGSTMKFSVAANGTGRPTVTTDKGATITPNANESHDVVCTSTEGDTNFSKGGAGVYQLDNITEATVVTATFPETKIKTSSSSSNRGIGWDVFQYDSTAGTTTTYNSESRDEPVTVAGVITNGKIVLNQEKGWKFTLSGADMESGWTYYIKEGTVRETGISADEYQYVAPVRTSDTNGNVTYTAKNISKGVSLEVEKVWQPVLSASENVKAEIVVDLQYSLQLAGQPASEWSDFANVSTQMGEGGLFANKGIPATSLVIKADLEDETKNWKGTFDKLPTTVKSGDDVYNVKYSVVESKVLIDGVETKRYKATTAYTAPDDPAASAGKVTVTNARQKVTVTAQKVWDPEPTEEGAKVTIELHRYAKKTKGTISVTLIDNNGAAIQGAVYTLYKDGEPTETTVTTDVNGYAAVSGLGPGSYKLVQKSTPNAYDMNADGCVTETGVLTVVDNTTAEQSLNTENTNKSKVTAGTVTLTVTNSYNNNAIENATFSLYNLDGLVSEGHKTNAQGKIVVGNLPAGTYHFEQTDTPNDYIMPIAVGTDSFTVENRPGEAQSFELTKKNSCKGKGIVVLRLTDAGDDDNVLSGATFQLTGNGVTLTGVTDDDGTIEFNNNQDKLYAGTYTITQLTEVAGYKPAAAQTAVIRENGNPEQIVECSVTNVLRGKGSATVTLTKEDGTPITGGTFRLSGVKSNGEIVSTSETTGDDGICRFVNLDEGTYTVTQTGTIEGYAVSSDTLEFTVEEGSVEQGAERTFVNGEDVGKITVKIIREQGSNTGWSQNTGGRKDGDSWSGLKPGDTIQIKITRRQSGHSMYYATDYDSYTHYGTWTKIEDNAWDGNDYYLPYTIPSSPDEATYYIGVSSSWGLDDGTVTFVGKDDENTNNIETTSNSRGTSTTGLLKRNTSISSTTASQETADTPAMTTKRKAVKAPSLKSVTVTDAQPVKVPADKANDYMEDSTFTVKTYEITSEDPDWKHVFDPEEKYDANGDPYYYYIIETSHTPANYWIESYTDPVAGDENTDAGTITVTNKRAPGALTITKAVKVDGGAVPANMQTAADGTYTFTITGPNSYSKTESITVTNGVATGNIVLEDLVPGNYTITETGSTNTNGITLDGPKTISVAAGSQASENIVAFTNNLVTADLTVLKVDVNGMTTPLPGAKFEIRRIDGEATSIRYIGSAVDPTTTGADNKTGDNGIATFAKLVTGYYEIWEKEPPPGYILTDGDGKFYVKVEAGAITAIQKTNSTAPKNWPSREDDAKFKFTPATKTAKVGNEPGAELPSTGGLGTHMIYLLGGMLTLAAGLLLLHGRKRIRT